MTESWPPPDSSDPNPLERARQDLLRALSGLKEEHCRAHPEPGEPSIQEALAVLVAFERSVVAALEREEAVTLLSPSDAEAAVARGNQLMLPALIHDLNAARHATLTALAVRGEPPANEARASLVEAIQRAVTRINRNAELLGLR